MLSLVIGNALVSISIVTLCRSQWPF